MRLFQFLRPWRGEILALVTVAAFYVIGWRLSSNHRPVAPEAAVAIAQVDSLWSVAKMNRALIDSLFQVVESLVPAE